MEEIVRMKPTMAQVQRSATTSHQSSSLVRDQNDIPSTHVSCVHAISLESCVQGLLKNQITHIIIQHYNNWSRSK